VCATCLHGREVDLEALTLCKHDAMLEGKSQLDLCVHLVGMFKRLS
jgi:hypothetical protein